MASSVKWNGNAFERLLKRSSSTGLFKAGEFLQEKCRDAVSNSGPSKAGSPPGRQTGTGQENIVMNHQEGTNPFARVGISRDALYMFYLEIGTRNVARRPWLVKTLYENQRIIGRLASTGGRK